MRKSEQILDRFKEKAASGCSAVYLRALKCDLSKLLSHYMALSDIDLNVKPMRDGNKLCIEIGVEEFYNIGK